MADLSKIRLNNTNYNIKDAAARPFIVDATYIGDQANFNLDVGGFVYDLSVRNSDIMAALEENKRVIINFYSDGNKTTLEGQSYYLENGDYYFGGFVYLPHHSHNPNSGGVYTGSTPCRFWEITDVWESDENNPDQILISKDLLGLDEKAFTGEEETVYIPLTKSGNNYTCSEIPYNLQSYASQGKQICLTYEGQRWYLIEDEKLTEPTVDHAKVGTATLIS